MLLQYSSQEAPKHCRRQLATENGNLTIYNDFHRYDPVADEWTPLGDFPGEARVAGTQFAKDGYGYILSGDGDNHGPLDYGEFWRRAAEVWNPISFFVRELSILFPPLLTPFFHGCIFSFRLSRSQLSSLFFFHMLCEVLALAGQ